MYQNIVCSYLYLAIKEQRTCHDTSKKHKIDAQNAHRTLYEISETHTSNVSRSQKHFFPGSLKTWQYHGTTRQQSQPGWKALISRTAQLGFAFGWTTQPQFFSFQAGFWRKLEVRQHGGWLGKDLQVQRRCKWGEFRVLSSKLCEPAHFQAQ